MPLRRRVLPGALAVAELEVDLTTPPAETAPPAASPTAAEAPVARATSAAARLATREPPSEPHDAVEPSATPASIAPAGPTTAGSTDAWTFDPRKPVDDLAPAAVARAVRDALPPPEARAQPVTGISKTGGLAEGLDAHDSSIGLGHGGPVVSALEVAAARSEAPDGNATFDVVVDASGHVSVALLSASSGAGAWSKVGATAGASLDPTRMRIPPGAGGWHVVAIVESKIQYPNGLEPKKLGTHVEGSPDIALAENEHRATVEDPPIVFKKMPHITVAHAGKVCSVALTIGLTFGSGITGGCDPSNIGAHTTRVVRSHVVREGRL
ncbi:MAG TPA: hypothetical protein VHS09_01270 [Polyangiaceae bacterium]|nr:hypothetical protein [Polyangiaceae bacterium]